MSLRDRLHDPSVLLRLGMLFLLLASAAHWFLHPAGSLGRELGDGVTGLLFGLSIALNLQAVRLARRRRCRKKS